MASSSPTVVLPIEAVSTTRVHLMRVTATAIASILVILALLLIAPRAFGLSFARTEGTSMNPLLKRGDAVLIRHGDGAAARVGDIILYPRNGRLILHRVVDERIDEAGQLIMVTKGDNLPQADEPVLATDVRGRLVGRVPVIGAASRAVGQNDSFKTIGELAWLIAALSLLCGGAWLAASKRSGGLRRLPETIRIP